MITKLRLIGLITLVLDPNHPESVYLTDGEKPAYVKTLCKNFIGGRETKESLIENS